MTRKRRNAIEAAVGTVLLLAALLWGVSRFQQLQIVSQVQTRNAELRATLEAIYQYEAEHGPQLSQSILTILEIEKNTITNDLKPNVTDLNQYNKGIGITGCYPIAIEWRDILPEAYQQKNVLLLRTMQFYGNVLKNEEFVEIGRAVAAPVPGRESDTPFQYDFPTTIGPGDRMNLLFDRSFDISNGLNSEGVLLQWCTCRYDFKTKKMSDALIFPAGEVIRFMGKKE